MKVLNPIEERNLFFRHAFEGLDIGDPEADPDETSLSRARRSIEVYDRPAGMQHAIIDARFPQDQMPAAPRASFPGSAVQARSKKVRRHLPIEGRGRTDKLIDCRKRPRDVLRRKAFAQPPTPKSSCVTPSYIVNATCESAGAEPG